MYTLSQAKWKSKNKRFKVFLKEENDLEVKRRAGGRLFHARGPATANARSPIDARRVGGITRSEVDAERTSRTSILVLFRLGTLTSAHTACTGYVVVPAAKVSPSEAVSHDRICGDLP